MEPKVMDKVIQTNGLKVGESPEAEILRLLDTPVMGLMALHKHKGSKKEHWALIKDFELIKR